MKRTDNIHGTRNLFRTILILASAVTLIMAGSGMAQASEHALISSGKYDQGFMGSTRLGAGNLAGKTVFMSGSQLQWIINHKVGIAITSESAGCGNQTDMTIGGKEYDVYYQLTGLEIEMFPDSDKMIHRSCGITVGGGLIESENRVEFWRESDMFFMIEPRTGIEMNVTKWMRVNGVFSWRFASGVNSELFDNKDMSGWTAMMTMKFGWF